MPVIRAAEADVHEMHNARFASYARPGTGSAELCVWQLEVAAGTVGAEHRVLREEVFVLLSGAIELTIDGATDRLVAGDAAIIPAEATIRVDNPDRSPATLVVSAPVGFVGELADGSRFIAPWVS
ncbi:cupin domain-containing protein [Nocardia blacklockiae]|uniref:cupin domain-containing protein n=1 Tax=Nocardia blacklockiae TaxID=480036 RepID=UPI00189302E5|nr:cupin domain-containing protein [Nocardia blacklockiae]MBF6171978.1 cupin domain-containing protein [Nocardia blacklockiae]